MAAKRLRVALRDQMQLRNESLDQLLPPEHAARAVWNFVAQLDLAAFLARIRVDAHSPGNTAIDPRTLVALWIQATLDGIGSARELERLTEHHLVSRWICGDEPINYHTLSDFRVAAGDDLSQLLTQSVASLVHANVADLTRVAQDGMRVRASAGASSFRREKTLQQHLKEAEEQVVILRSQVDEDSGAASRRAEAAKVRGATERVARIEQAMQEMQALQNENAKRASTPSNKQRVKDPEQLRVSETDPEARKMKMGDGGFRPAFNVQFATTTIGGVIVGVSVTNAGTDGEQLPPMLEQLQDRYDARPKEVLADGGFASLDAIDAAERGGTTVFAPLKNEAKQLDAEKDPYAKKKGDTPELANWRQRMGTPEAKAIYLERAATAELSNAQARNRGLQQFSVRGLAKCGVVATWYALVHNVQRGISTGVWKPD
jgi:transposase